MSQWNKYILSHDSIIEINTNEGKRKYFIVINKFIPLSLLHGKLYQWSKTNDRI